MSDATPSPIHDLLNAKSIDELSFGEMAEICRKIHRSEHPTQAEGDLFEELVAQLVTWDMSMGPGRREMMRRAAEAQRPEQEQKVLTDTPPAPESGKEQKKTDQSGGFSG